MFQSLQLNIIQFVAPVQEAYFTFYTAKQNGYCPIHKDDLNGAFEGLVDESELHYGNWLYTDFAPAKENTIIISVNLMNVNTLSSTTSRTFRLQSNTPQRWLRYSHTSPTTNYPTTAKKAYGFFKIIIK